MDESIFDRFRLTMMEKNLGVYGIHVYSDKLGEADFRWRADDKVCLYSASKTFTSVGVGIAADEGRFALGDRALDFFPEYQSAAFPESDKITLRDLLHMSSGKLTFWGWEDIEKAKSADWAELFFREPVSCRPGQRFFYSNLCTYMLGRVIEKVSGRKLRDYLAPRLFDKLEIWNPQWHECPGGHTLAATELFLTTGELARLGETLLHEGEYRGKRIVSAEYVGKMHSDVVDCGWEGADSESAAGYGYQVWRCTQPGVYRADGMYGQFSIVIPDRGAAVTVTSHNERCANDIIRAVFRDILPQL